MALLCRGRERKWRQEQLGLDATRRTQNMTQPNRPDTDVDGDVEAHSDVEMGQDGSFPVFLEGGTALDSFPQGAPELLSPGTTREFNPIDWPGESPQMGLDSDEDATGEQGEGWEQDTVDVGVVEGMSVPASSGSSGALRFEPMFESTCQLYIQHFSPAAGVPRGPSVLEFQNQRDLDIVRGHNEFGPFLRRKTWEQAKWLMRRGITSEARDEFLRLETTRDNPDIPWINETAFIKKVDRLQRGPRWNCKTVQIEGDNGGRSRVEEHDLWTRDIFDCARELIGNPAFRGEMVFTPEKHFRDEAGTVPVYDEMWTGSWWWETQEHLSAGMSLGALILASDKTQLTKLSGDKEAWPVYLSLGNIPKDVRRKVSRHAMVLVAYIPIAKLKCFKSRARRQKERWDFFHTCMKEILRPLRELGDSTVPIVCCDNVVRDFVFVVAAYIADHPEQSLVCCTRESRCPGCQVSPKRRELLDEMRVRDQMQTLKAIRAALGNRGTRLLDALGLRPTWPFWARLPNRVTNVHKWFWPDILHQLTKGMLEHLKDWVVSVAGEEEIDSRCETLTRHPGLKSFSKGLSDVKQWTGNEFKDLLRILMAITVHAIPDNAVVAVRAYIDFQFFALLHRHTQATIDAMQEKLQIFHSHREVFRTLGAVTNFNFPKSHSIYHFPSAISQIGASDGTNSEGPERLHIAMAKVAYHAVKKTDYIRLMTVWLDRQEALNRHEAYISWVQSGDDSSGGTLDILDLSAEGAPPNHDPISHPRTNQSLTSLAYVTLSSRRHIIAKRPSLKPKARLHLSEMTQVFGLFNFLSVANHFISQIRQQDSASPSSISEQHVFGCWSRFRIYHRTLYEFGTSDEHEQVRTLPSLGGYDLGASKDGIFDTVLVYTTPGKVFPHCYQAAQVRAIFMFPTEFVELQGKHFALVELFTRFPANPHAASGFFPVSRLVTSNTVPASRIVPITDIHFSCHLTGKVRRASEITWTSHQSLNECKTFYLNTDVSRRLWALSMGILRVE